MRTNQTQEGPRTPAWGLTSHWSPSAFTPFYERLHRDPGWRTVSVPRGHEVMVGMPQELTQILLDAV